MYYNCCSSNSSISVMEGGDFIPACSRGGGVFFTPYRFCRTTPIPPAINNERSLKSPILEVWCDEDVMTYYNNDNNAYCSAVNAQNFETREHNTVKISTFLYTRNLYSYSHLEIFICIYSVRGEIDQISTNTFRYTTCCLANVYMFVYILIGACTVPLTHTYTTSRGRSTD